MRKGAAWIALLALAGCTNGAPGMPDIGFETELGAVRANTSGIGSNPATTDLSGSYTGTGTVARNPGGTCPVNQPVSNFQVSGDRVSFGRFSGTIGANGSIQMVEGRNWVVGQFNGPNFTGRIIMPACSYQIAMTRTG